MARNSIKNLIFSICRCFDSVTIDECFTVFSSVVFIFNKWPMLRKICDARISCFVKSRNRQSNFNNEQTHLVRSPNCYIYLFIRSLIKEIRPNCILYCDNLQEYIASNIYTRWCTSIDKYEKKSNRAIIIDDLG